MDLTPDLLLEAKFAPARRGYDMNEVDDFLERCAEGLDVLLARLRAEFDRAERAEAALVELRATGAAPAVDALTETVPVPDTERVPEPQAEAAPASTTSSDPSVGDEASSAPPSSSASASGASPTSPVGGVASP
ncbi:MAG TPA: DivIVA domain-containing protein, partial [Acidimicrobiales bacterium]|nr:DivIVA domain-containing protein [Acidimicrobiales bacterium]